MQLPGLALHHTGVCVSAAARARWVLGANSHHHNKACMYTSTWLPPSPRHKHADWLVPWGTCVTAHGWAAHAAALPATSTSSSHHPIFVSLLRQESMTATHARRPACAYGIAGGMSTHMCSRMQCACAVQQHACWSTRAVHFCAVHALKWSQAT